MAVNFPNNPQVGETYTLGSRTWQWSGTFWRAVSTTVGYTGSQGGGFNFLGTVATEQDLPLPYSGEESDAYVVAATGILWIWDGSSWGPVGQFTGYTGSRGTPGASVRIVGSVADQSLLPTPYGGNIGDGYLLADTGHLWTWDGTAWNDIGKLAGDVGATGFTGSIGFTGSTGYTGSVGESTFTWGDTAPENPAIGDRWFDTVVGAVTVYVDDGDSQAWLEVAGSGFMGQTGYTGSGSGSGPKVSGIDYPGDATAADPAGGETLGIQGSGFESGAHVLLDNQAVGQVVFVSATRLEFVAPSKTEGTYAYLYVINPDGGVAIHVPGVQYSGAPSWSTPAAGNLGSVYETQSINQSFAAVSDSSVTYSLASGTLPAGSTLDPATGVLSGTVGVIDNATTYTFIIRATDAESQTADRQFSLTVDADSVTWSSPTDGDTVSVPVDTTSTTTLSAASAAGDSITYSANTLPSGLTLSGDTITGTANTIGDTSVALTATADITARSATVIVTFSVIQISDYIATPTATPAAFGDALEGGFYTGLIWNQVTQSATSTTIGTGSKTFTVTDDMAATPLFYGGQEVEVRSRANPATARMIGTVTNAQGTTLTVNVTSVDGSGTLTDWSVMAKYRVIVAPKSSGENSSKKYKNVSTAAPAACGTLTEGLKATLAMVADGSSTVYPAAHFCNDLSIGGYSDWYLPARDELELIYRNLKPYTNNNFTSSRPNGAVPNYTNLGSIGTGSTSQGVNYNSDPQGAAYTTTVPGQTSVAAFQTGGAEAMGSLPWSSTEYSTETAWLQFFSTSLPGYQNRNTKTDSSNVRAVRRSII